jgi:predicted nuclease of predicted toxin-antitoxin system
MLPALRQVGHDITVIAVDYPPSLPDHQVLAIAYQEERILITEDRDFGELVFRLDQPSRGVIFLRLPRVELAIKLQRLTYALTYYADQFDQFLVVTLRNVRVRRRI